MEEKIVNRTLSVFFLGMCIICFSNSAEAIISVEQNTRQRTRSSIESHYSSTRVASNGFILREMVAIGS